MSPSAVSVLAPAIAWEHETLWPAKVTPPTAAGVLTNLNTSVSDTSFGWYTQHVGQFSAGGTNTQRAAAGRWCVRCNSTTDASTAAMFRRFPTWCPFLDPASAPADGGDESSRLAWIRFHVLAGLDINAGATTDALGVSIIADDGLTDAPTTWRASLAGGFGIYKRAGLGTWRYASYSAAPALLEAVDLPSADGWHSADFVFRQAVRGNLATPWLTFTWDGVDVFTERAFGHALLPAPAALRAGAHGWAFMLGAHLTSGDLSVSMECRQGGRTVGGAPLLR